MLAALNRAGLAVTTLVLIATGYVQFQGQEAFPRIARINWTWAHESLQRADTWVGEDGSLGLQTMMPGQRTALDLLPHATSPATAHAKAELVLYNTLGKDWSRMNWSSMAGRWPAYRFGVERGGNAKFLPIQTTFENVKGGLAYEPFYVMSPDDEMNPGFNATMRLVLQSKPIASPGHSGVGVMFRVGPRENDVQVRWLQVGPPDSAGPGKRLLMVDN